MTYDRDHPFLATVTKRIELAKPESTRRTVHIEIDLADSGITYRPGDCLAVMPTNPEPVVRNTLAALNASGEELVSFRNSDPVSIRTLLTSKVDLCRCSKKLVQIIEERTGDPFLSQLLNQRVELKAFLEKREVWDLLQEYPSANISPQELTTTLLPLLPRFYSIASSQMAVGDSVHLTVGAVKYETNGHERVGCCSEFLCDSLPLNQPAVPIYLHPTKDFLLPDPARPILMIGPGTGIAPFRSFLQERIATKATGSHWLFFGERNRVHDFYYEQEWQPLVASGKLQLDLAFSRDQNEKVYVQHLMLQKAEEIWQWIDQGAVIYVCGDAQKMAKDVDSALQTIIQEQGNISDPCAFIKEMRKTKRYLRDVY
jgi:sulfite reductase (NADPH) flavoprotein alpha-component